MFGLYVRVTGIPLLIAGVLSQISEKDLLNKFRQSDYHIMYDRCELVRYNKVYSKHAKISTFKYNRTAVGVNATFDINFNLGPDVLVVLQVYKFMSNEYRYFPIRVQIHVCDILKNNLMGFAGYTRCGNFTGCPLNKGSYQICNFVMDETRFPPLIPNGKYLIEFTGIHAGNEMFVIHSYGTVIHPEILK